MGVAPLRTYRQNNVDATFTIDTLHKLCATIENLGDQCRDALRLQNISSEAIGIRTILNVKVLGSDTTLPITWNEPEQMLQAFRRAHRRRFGFKLTDQELHIESLRVEATGDTDASLRTALLKPPEALATESIETTKLFSEGEWRHASVYHRSNLRGGQKLSGPTIINDDTATTVVESEWCAEIDKYGHLALKRDRPMSNRKYSNARHAERAAGSGNDGGIQQPFHEYRRTDGCGSREHRAFCQHKGTPGFFLRVVRSGRQLDRQRATHSSTPRRHG